MNHAREIASFPKNILSSCSRAEFSAKKLAIVALVEI